MGPYGDGILGVMHRSAEQTTAPTYRTVRRCDETGTIIDIRWSDEPLQYTESGLMIGVVQHPTRALTMSVGTNHLRHDHDNQVVLDDLSLLFDSFVSIVRSNGLPTYFVHEGRDILLPSDVTAQTIRDQRGRSPENLWIAWLARKAGIEQKGWDLSDGQAITLLRDKGFANAPIMAYLLGRQFRQAATTHNPKAYIEQHVIKRYEPYFPEEACTYETAMHTYAKLSHDHIRPIEQMEAFATDLTTGHMTSCFPAFQNVKHPIIAVAHAHNLDRHNHHMNMLLSEGPGANLFDLSGSPHLHRLDHYGMFDRRPFTPPVEPLFGSLALMGAEQPS